MAVAVPDYAEARVGWRVWNVVERDGELLLASLVYDTPWLPGEALEASCRRPLAALPLGRMPLHDAPSLDCVCGIYAVRAAAQAVAYLHADVEPEHGDAVQRILGCAALWGRIVEGPLGWRASRAYPQRLIVPRRKARELLFHRSRIPREDVLRALAAYAVPMALLDRLPLGDGMSIRL